MKANEKGLKIFEDLKEKCRRSMGDFKDLQVYLDDEQLKKAIKRMEDFKGSNKEYLDFNEKQKNSFNALIKALRKKLDE